MNLKPQALKQNKFLCCFMVVLFAMSMVLFPGLAQAEEKRTFAYVENRPGLIQNYVIQSGTYITADDGNVAYCLSQGAASPTVDQVYVYADVASTEVSAILDAGYPNTTTINGVKLTDDEARQATQAALWCVSDYWKKQDLSGYEILYGYGKEESSQKALDACRYLVNTASKNESTSTYEVWEAKLISGYQILVIAKDVSTSGSTSQAASEKDDENAVTAGTSAENGVTTGNLNVDKVVMGTGDAISGSTFVLFNADNQLVDVREHLIEGSGEVVVVGYNEENQLIVMNDEVAHAPFATFGLTTNSGTLRLENLPTGSYTLSEISAAPGYFAAEDMVITIAADETLTVLSESELDVASLSESDFAFPLSIAVGLLVLIFIGVCAFKFDTLRARLPAGRKIGKHARVGAI